MLALRDWEKGVKFDYIRDGAMKSVVITPKSKGDVEGVEVECKRWGLTAKEINRFDTPDLAFMASEGGVFVSSVAWDGNADNAGFKERDIIKRIGGKEVKDAGELKKIYDDAVANVEKTFQLGVEVVRKGRKMQLVLNFRLDPEKEESL